MLTKMWDVDIGARLIMQSSALFVDTVMGKEKDAFLEILMDVAHKQQAMRYHLEQYRRLEVELHDYHVAEFAKGPNVNSESFPLIYAFESFMFQLKSALDIVVKTLKLVPFKKEISTGTYGNKGSDVLRGLRANQDAISKLVVRGHMHDGHRWLARIDDLIALVEAARAGWLTDAIEIRDTFSHYKAAKNFLYLPVLVDGRYDATRPVFERHGKKILPLPLMEDLLKECLHFCQDFACRAMAFRMHIQGIELGPMDPAMAKSYAPEPYASCIRWAWVNDAGDHIRGALTT